MTHLTTTTRPPAKTHSQVNGLRCYVYRAVDQHGQIIDVLVSKRRDGVTARRLFQLALTTLKVTPTEVVTDAAPVYPRVLDELVPAARHHVERYANNRIKPITADSNTGYDPCAAYAPTARSESITAGLASLQNLRSAATNSPPKPHATCESPPRSPNSRRRSETQSPHFTMPNAWTMQQRPPPSTKAFR